MSDNEDTSIWRHVFLYVDEHGSLRLVNAPHRRKQIMQSIIMLIAITLFSANAVLLVKNYVYGDTSVMSKLVSTKQPKLPDVTICLNFYYDEWVFKRGVPLLQESPNVTFTVFFDQMSRFWTAVRNSAMNDTITDRDLESRLNVNNVRRWSRYTFYPYGMKSPYLMSPYNYLLICQWRGLNCFNTTNSFFRTLYSADGGACSNFYFDNTKYSVVTTDDIFETTVLFPTNVDYSRPPAWYSFSNNSELFHIHSVKVYFHERGTYPDFSSPNFMALLAKTSNFVFDSVYSQKLPPNCLSDTRKYKLWNGPNDTITFSYSSELCALLAEQSLIYNECQCHSETRPMSADVAWEDVNFCHGGHSQEIKKIILGSVSPNSTLWNVNVQMMKRKLVCLNQMEVRLQKTEERTKIKETCMYPCARYSKPSAVFNTNMLYAYQSSAYQAKFLKLVRRRKMEESLRLNISINSSYWSYIDNDGTTFNISGWGEANDFCFAIHMASIRLVTTGDEQRLYAEFVTYVMSNLFADMGGALGMFLGISAISLVELFEKVFSMICVRKLQ